MNISFQKKNHETDNRVKYSNYGPAKRHIAKWRWYLVVLILLSPIIFISYKIIDSRLDDSFRGFVYFNTVMIVAPEDAYIEKQNLKIGSKVTKGQNIFTLNSTILNEQIIYTQPDSI